ncbi:hypothetical protein GCM10009551_094140 [Nocardiopsis tropica]
MYPMTLWSVDDSQLAMSLPWRVSPPPPVSSYTSGAVDTSATIQTPEYTKQRIKEGCPQPFPDRRAPVESLSRIPG